MNKNVQPTQPYQPLLLRLLHALTSLGVLGAMLTAVWTYNTYDGRWGKLPLPDNRAIEGIHGTFGLYTLLIFPALVLYAFHRGQRRLLQSDSLTRLTQLDQPIGWYSWGRLANTLTLITLSLAVFSGKMMDETWLPKGELDHLWYSIHLLAWVGMGVAIALHLALNAKVGGSPLLQSIWQTKFRAKDSPQLWPSRVSAWWSQVRALSWPERLTALAARPKLELTIWLSLVAAWGISLAKELMFSR